MIPPHALPGEPAGVEEADSYFMSGAAFDLRFASRTSVDRTGAIAGV